MIKTKTPSAVRHLVAFTLILFACSIFFRMDAFAQPPEIIWTDYQIDTTGFAVVSAIVDPHGHTCTAWFEWGHLYGNHYANATRQQHLAGDTVVLTVSDTLFPPWPNDYYVFRVFLADSTSTLACCAVYYD